MSVFYGFLKFSLYQPENFEFLRFTQDCLKTKDIEARNWFLKELLDDEIKSGHNGKIIIDGTDAMIEVWTHDISAVTELDLEYAARCDDIFSDAALLGELEYEYR